MSRYNNHPGYALLLVLLLLSVFVSSASALARIVVLNLRQVRFVDQAIVASSAASSGVEYGLYQFRKAVPGNVTAVKTDDKSIGEAEVDVIAEKKEETWFKIAKDDFAAITLSPQSGISSITFSNWTPEDGCQATSWIELSKTEWDLNNLTDPVVTHQPYPMGSLLIENINSDKMTELRLKALYCDVSKIVVQGQPTALPSRIIIKAVGEYRGTKQAQQISTLEKEPLAGLFDYAVFSECSLTNKNNIECP